MSTYEYKVVPAPQKGQKGKGVKGGEGRFALALETLMNELAAEGWEYQRAETLPSQERSGIAGTTTEWRNVLVFRRREAIPEFSHMPVESPVPRPIPSPMSPRPVPGPRHPLPEPPSDADGYVEQRSNLAHLSEARPPFKSND